MDVIVFTETELSVALGAVRAVDPYPTAAQDDFLRAVARLHGLHLDPPALRRPSLEETAASIVEPRQRMRVLELAIVMSTIDGEVTAIPTANVSSLARALGFDERATRTLREVSHHHHLLTRIDLTRRLGGRLVKNAWREEGWGGIQRLRGPILNVAEDLTLAARYQALADCPSGSLGRALFDHYRAHDFRFPGERGGMPEQGVFHDLGHVLSGYGTDAEGELQQAAFQAGFVRCHGFSYLLFGIVQFHLGVKVASITDGEHGVFDVRRVLEALARGAGCRVDPSEDFDLFRHASRPLDEVRSELGIIPLEGAASQRLVA